MRVNMDSSIATEPRFKILGREVGRNWKEAIGSLFLVWLACYERRSVRLSVIEADIAAEIDGFAHALVRVGLADLVSNGEHIDVHGVEQRIKFLLEQQERGSRGGKNSVKSRRSRHEAKGQPNAKANASRAAQAYTPDLPPDHTPSPDLAPALSPPIRIDLERIYRLYPKKQGRKRGLEAAQRLIATQDDYDAVLSCVETMATAWSGRDLQFCPHFDTFIRQERWRDEMPPLPVDARSNGNGKHGRVEPVPREYYETVPLEEKF